MKKEMNYIIINWNFLLFFLYNIVIWKGLEICIKKREGGGVCGWEYGVLLNLDCCK